MPLTLTRLARNWRPTTSRRGSRYVQFQCYQRAAEVAERVYAHDEAIGLLKHGLRLLPNVADRARRDEQELDMLRLLSLALVATQGYGRRRR